MPPTLKVSTEFAVELAARAAGVSTAGRVNIYLAAALF